MSANTSSTFPITNCNVGVVYATPDSEPEWKKIVPDALIFTDGFHENFEHIANRQRAMKMAVNIGRATAEQFHFALILDEENIWRVPMNRQVLATLGIHVYKYSPRFFYGKKLFSKEVWEFAAGISSGNEKIITKRAEMP